MNDEALLHLSVAGASAAVSLAGAELQSWRVDGRELIWQGDPEHWAQRAPILFPVIGESAGGQVRLEGRSYPMPRHGFARDMRFALIEKRGAALRLRLIASAATRAFYPFDFGLDVIADLGPDRLRMTFEVANGGVREMPYAVGFHPAFAWPLDGMSRTRHVVEFEANELPDIPNISPEGLIRKTLAGFSSMAGGCPPPFLFESGALVLRDACSRSLRFVSPSGAALEYSTDGFPHFALWTKPSAPFLSIEAWTGEPDAVGFRGDLRDRRSIRLLAPGATASHSVRMRWQAP